MQCFITRWNTSKFVKNTPLRVVFSTLFSVFHLVMKHCISCLIYYVKSLWWPGQKVSGPECHPLDGAEPILKSLLYENIQSLDVFICWFTTRGCCIYWSSAVIGWQCVSTAIKLPHARKKNWCPGYVLGKLHAEGFWFWNHVCCVTLQVIDWLIFKCQLGNPLLSPCWLYSSMHHWVGACSRAGSKIWKERCKTLCLVMRRCWIS